MSVEKSPLISIIMTAYNTARYLPVAIESVLCQTYDHWELLVADDGSTDASRAIIDSFSEKDERIKATHNEENAHYLRTRNRLINIAEGAFITFLDSDDRMTPDRLEKQLTFMQQRPDTALCGSFVSYIDESGHPLKVQREDPPTDDQAIRNALPNFNPVTGSTIFIRAEILKAFGGYRDFFHGLCSEDYDLVSRVAEKYPIANVPERLYIYRQFEASTSRAGRENPMKRFSGEIVQSLIQERRQGKEDAIARGDLDVISNWVDEFAAPYESDASLVYIDLVASHLHAGLKRKAFYAAWLAIKANPWKSYNYRTLWYTVKKLVR